ncbi:MAG: hydroxymethylbilane synthase [Candidatus Ratteibacteria bacterium]
MGKKIYRIGTRPSNLALKQVEEIIKKLEKINIKMEYEIIKIETTGDIDKKTSLSFVEGTDFFTDKIEEKLLEGEIDFAVHSAKDLPDKIREGLFIAAITKPLDPYDAFVSKDSKKLQDLEYGARIGTSSENRKKQLKNFRPDFEIVDIRGNIEERIKLIEKLKLDGIVVAKCALIRLGLEDLISQTIPFEIIKPHPLQGCLAVEIRKDDYELKKIFKLIDGK